MDTLRDSIHLATSKPARRVLLNTILVIAGAATLLGLAVISTALFFQNYVPQRLVEVPIYLQYGSGLNPYGVVSLSHPSLKSAQHYDVSVSVALPRSPPNLDRGNFMVRLSLLDRDINNDIYQATRLFADGHDQPEGYNVLFSARRPALMPFVDPLVALASRSMLLLYHLLVPSSRSCTMRIPLAEDVVFSRDAEVPASAYLELEAGQTIQTYAVTLRFAARLRGLRGLMYHYRLFTYIVFTSLFWLCEILFMAGAWALWGIAMSSQSRDSSQVARVGTSQKGYQAVKNEDEDEEEENNDGKARKRSSGAVRGSRVSIKAEADVKDEDDDELGQSLLDIPLEGAEADDEGEGAEERR